jgi:hypothetical protein
MKTTLLFFLLGYQIICVIDHINPPGQPKPLASLRIDLNNPKVTLDAS